MFPNPYMMRSVTNRHGCRSGCLVSILRLRSLVAISNSTDPTFDNPPAATWSSIECSVGIICASLPALKPLLAKIFPGVIVTVQFPSTTQQHNRDSFVSKDVNSSKSLDRPRSSSSGSASTMGSKGLEIDLEKGQPAFNVDDHRARISTRAARSTNPSIFDQARNLNDIKVVTVVEQTVLDKGLPPLPE
jgi:hypothetical protein